MKKGDRVRFLRRGVPLTGKIVRVRKDGLVTVDVVDSDDEDLAYVDVSPTALTVLGSSKPQVRTASDIQALSLLPPRKFAAEVLKLTRKALSKGECGQALFFLNLGKTRKIVSSKAGAVLKARVDRCYRNVRGGA